ncbi:protein-glutamate O-methyltransferase CheR [Vibrio navarrensis]
MNVAQPKTQRPKVLESFRPITDDEFGRFRELIFRKAGISMADEKKVLVSGRLSKRLRHYHLNTFEQYYQLVRNTQQYPSEMQVMVDLLTTNETYFFREPNHFEFLRQHLKESRPNGTFRIWSAACSSGEEVYTLAMTLAEALPHKTWEVVGSDVSQRMLDHCQKAVYPLSRRGSMSDYYLRQYCLKGIRQQEGYFLVERFLRSRCTFHQVNLIEPLPNLGLFDAIFLRNVMIYFNRDTKQKVIQKLLQQLKPNGLLFIGHSESLNGLDHQAKLIRSSIYRKQCE